MLDINDTTRTFHAPHALHAKGCSSGPDGKSAARAEGWSKNCTDHAIALEISLGHSPGNWRSSGMMCDDVNEAESRLRARSVSLRGCGKSDNGCEVDSTTADGAAAIQNEKKYPPKQEESAHTSMDGMM